MINYSGNAKLYVADNASTDGSIVFLKEHYPELSLILLDDNTGFCGGYNRALSQIEAEYFVLLNSDVEVTDRWLEPMFDFLSNNPPVAACQPKIKSYDDKTRFEYAGAGGGFIDYLGYPFCRGRIFDDLEVDKGQYNDIHEIFWATGAGLMIRADLYKRFGGLDEKFFAHMEEIDLCWRLRNNGFKIYYVGKSEIFHVGGGTLNRSSNRKTFFNFRNCLFLLAKNVSAKRNLPLLLFTRLILDGVAGLRFVLLGEFGFSIAILKAHFSFYQNLPYILRKREEFPVLNKDKDPLIYNKSIVFQYFLKNNKEYSKLD